MIMMVGKVVCDNPWFHRGYSGTGRNIHYRYDTSDCKETCQFKYINEIFSSHVQFSFILTIIAISFEVMYVKFACESGNIVKSYW